VVYPKFTIQTNFMDLQQMEGKKGYKIGNPQSSPKYLGRYEQSGLNFKQTGVKK